MFKFLKDDDEDHAKDPPASSRSIADSQEPPGRMRKFQNHLVTELHYRIAYEVSTSVYKDADGNELKYIMINELLQSRFVQEDDVVSKILASTSDLIPGVYEGNLPIWGNPNS